MITDAAILHDGDLWIGRRHHEIIAQMRASGVEKPITGEQGFVNSDGAFLNRIDAAAEAIACGQIAKLNWPPRLYSEDLW
jgi:hypothetical protein